MTLGESPFCSPTIDKPHTHAHTHRGSSLWQTRQKVEGIAEKKLAVLDFSISPLCNSRHRSNCHIRYCVYFFPRDTAKTKLDTQWRFVTALSFHSLSSRSPPPDCIVAFPRDGWNVHAPPHHHVEHDAHKQHKHTAPLTCQITFKRQCNLI